MDLLGDVCFLSPLWQKRKISHSVLTKVFVEPLHNSLHHLHRIPCLNPTILLVSLFLFKTYLQSRLLQLHMVKVRWYLQGSIYSGNNVAHWYYMTVAFSLGYGRANVTCLNHCNLDWLPSAFNLLWHGTCIIRIHCILLILFSFSCRTWVIHFVAFMQNGVSALMIACSRGDHAIVQLLLNNNAYVNLQALVCLLTSTPAHGTYLCTSIVYTHITLIFLYSLLMF